MRLPHSLLLTLLLPCLLAAATTQAADPAKSQGTIVELTAEASRTAPNDLARASAYVEAAESTSKEVAARVNAATAQALEMAKAYSSIKVQSAGSRTWPQYDKNGRIVGWHMRSDLQLESRDMSALSELLGKLQSLMGISQIQLTPATETRIKAENAAIVDALSAFEARAKLIASSMRGRYRIRQINITTPGSRRPVFFPAAATKANIASDTMPIEVGETQLTVTITGQIELTD